MGYGGAEKYVWNSAWYGKGSGGPELREKDETHVSRADSFAWVVNQTLAQQIQAVGIRGGE